MITASPADRQEARSDLRGAFDDAVPTLVAVTVVLAGAVTASGLVHPGPGLHAVLVFAHLACLVVGLGGVLTVDLYGVRWMLGQMSQQELLAAARRTHPQIWMGYLGLVVTGTFLSPTATVLTGVKLLAVLAIGWVGVVAGALFRQGRPRVAYLLAAGTVSQLAWWTATVIGFMRSQG